MNEFLTKWKINVEKFIWNFCDIIVVNAEGVKHYLVESEGIPEQKIKGIYNGVDTDFFFANTDSGNDQTKTNVVGMVACFKAQKNHKTFLDAAKIV